MLLRQYSFYLLRWQLSTPILAYILYLLSAYGELQATMMANLVGGLIFFWVDRYLFSRGANVKIRDGWVSNSSSSSYIIKKADILPDAVAKTVKVLKLIADLDEFEGEFKEHPDCYQVYLGFGVEDSAIELAKMLDVPLTEGWPEDDDSW